MSGPWERYQPQQPQTPPASPESGPWSRYAAPAPAAPERPRAPEAPQRPQTASAPRPAAPAFTGDMRAEIERLVPGVRFNSGYRSPAHNQSVGGVPNSYHTRGRPENPWAFDLSPPQGMSMGEMHRILSASGLPFAENLNEGDHVHVAWNGGTGQTAQAVAAQPPTDAAPMADVRSPSGLRPILAEVGDPESGLLPGATGELGSRTNPYDATTLSPERIAELEGSYFGGRNEDGSFWRAGIGPSYGLAEMPDNAQQVGDLNLVPRDQGTNAYTQAFAEQVPFLDEGLAALIASTSGQTYGDVRQQFRDEREDQRRYDQGDRNLGGLAGFGTTMLVAPGSGWIGQGANAAFRARRAAAVGGLTGSVYGAGSADDGERLAGAGLGLLTGAGAGAAFQGIADNLTVAAQRAASTPTAQRLLSDAGVRITPGQALGGGFQRLEDAATSLPVLGDTIRDAQRRSLESFDTATINQVLDTLSPQAPARALSPQTPAGRGAVREGADIISAEYQRILNPLNLAPDAQVAQDVAAAAQGGRLTQALRDELQSLIDNYVTPHLGQAIDGQTFKAVDRELAAAIRAADRGAQSQPSQGILRNQLRQVREAWRGWINRADPQAAEALDRADEAFAQFERVRGAASSTGTARNDGLFTPAQLNQAVASSDRRAYGTGDALLQPWSDAAMEVLPPTVPDSGTPFRSFINAPNLGAMAAGLGAIPLSVAYRGLDDLMAAGRWTNPGTVRGAAGRGFGLLGRSPVAVQGLLDAPRDGLAGLLSDRTRAPR